MRVSQIEPQIQPQPGPEGRRALSRRRGGSWSGARRAGDITQATRSNSTNSTNQLSQPAKQPTNQPTNQPTRQASKQESKKASKKATSFRAPLEPGPQTNPSQSSVIILSGTADCQRAVAPGVMCGASFSFFCGRPLQESHPFRNPELWTHAHVSSQPFRGMRPFRLSLRRKSR